MNTLEPCPKCGSFDFLVEKMMLLNKVTPEWLRDHQEGAPQKGPCVHDIKEEFVNQEPLDQFVSGFYCSKCGIGFIKKSNTNY